MWALLSTPPHQTFKESCTPDCYYKHNQKQCNHEKHALFGKPRLIFVLLLTKHASILPPQASQYAALLYQDEKAVCLILAEKTPSFNCFGNLPSSMILR